MVNKQLNKILSAVMVGVILFHNIPLQGFAIDENSSEQQIEVAEEAIPETDAAYSNSVLFEDIDASMMMAETEPGFDIIPDEVENSDTADNLDDTNNSDVTTDWNVWEEEHADEASQTPSVSAQNGIIGEQLVENEALITSLEIMQVVDGSAPFDNDNSPGNDSSSDNGVIRSFDSAEYMFEMTTGLQEWSQYTSFQSGKVYLEIELPLSSNEGRFNTDIMAWLPNNTSEYQYWEIVENADKQILTVAYELTRDMGTGVAIPGTVKLNVAIETLGVPHGRSFSPVITAWMAGNEADPDFESGVAKTITGRELIVSAAPKYNLNLSRNPNLAYKDTFDLSGGTTVSGRIFGFGVTMQLYNEAVSAGAYAGQSKGLKGIEIPVGEITFDLDMKMEQITGSGKQDITVNNTPILWDYKNNIPGLTGNLGREMGWLNYTSAYSASNMPWGNMESSTTPGGSVNDSGQITAVQAGGSNIIRVTIQDFDFGDYIFPYRNAGGPSDVVQYSDMVGCFSAGYLQVIAPIPANASANTNYVLTVTAKNFQAVSNSDQVVTEQRVTDDDTSGITFAAVIGAVYAPLNFVTEPEKNTWVHGLYSNFEFGDGWSSPGARIKVWGGYVVSGSGDSEYWVRSVNILQKFDDEAFYIPDGSLNHPDSISTNYTGGSGMEYTFIYGTKPDGLGWIDDEEMNAASEDDLRFYSSMDAVPSGHKVVAVLMEGRNGVARGGAEDKVGVYLQIAEDALIGKVYQTTNQIRIWTTSLASQYTRANTEVTNYPSYITIDDPYVKTVYKNGDILAGTHLNSYCGGQSILIVGHKTTIEKSVAQKAGDSAKKVYDLDADERQVDFVLSPGIAMANDEPNSSGERTSITIVDTLPEGLTYLPDSVIIGSPLVDEEYENTSRMAGGIVLTEGEEILLPDGSTVIFSQSGQVLTWQYENVLVGAEMGLIHYSVTIGSPYNPAADAVNAQEYSSTVTIQSRKDGRALRAEFANLSTYTIRVKKLGRTTFTKNVERPLYEVGEEIVFTMLYSNSSNEDIAQLNILDILPYVDDQRGSVFNGSYQIKSLTLDTTYAASAQLEVYVTADSAVRSESASSVNYDESWILASAGSTAAEAVQHYSLPEDDREIFPTAVGITGSLGQMEAIQITFILKPVYNQGGDIYSNSATAYASNTAKEVIAPAVKAFVAGRTISGKAWIDQNQDGLINSGEKPLAGVEVVLKDDQGKVVEKDISGRSFGSVYTQSDGTYSYVNLPAGAYQVVFGSSDILDLSEYILTVRAVEGNEGENDSKAEPVVSSAGLLQSAFINNLNTPTLEEMTGNDYQIRNQNAGFYKIDNEEESTETESEAESETSKKDDELTDGLDQTLEFTKSAVPAGGIDEQTAMVVRQGSTITYTIELKLSVAETGIVVSDVIPQGLLLVEDSISYTNAAGQQVAVGDQAYNQKTNKITWPMMDVDEGVTLFQFKAAVDRLESGVYSKVYQNKAVLSYSETGKKDLETNLVTHKTNSGKPVIHKTAVTIQGDGNLGDMKNIAGAGSELTPIITEPGQIVEYQLTVIRTADAENKSGEMVVVDVVPKSTTFIEGSISGEFTSIIEGSSAVIKSMDYVLVQDQDGSERVAIVWVLDGLADGETASLKFRVYAPTS